MQNYVLRIYRREKRDPRILVGVVEEVGVEGNKAFRSLDELWSILNPLKVESPKTKKRDKSLKQGEQGENKH